MRPRLLLLDHHDSFTWNLAHLLLELGADLRVEQSDRATVAGVVRRRFDAVVLSPGPGSPADAGISERLVREIGERTPILGVCLGHQVIAMAHGARVVRAPALVHGKTSRIEHDGRGVFRGLPPSFPATRYHSLVVDPASLGPELEPCAWTADRVVMGLRHRRLPLHGVQFHPESVLTAAGKRLVANFLEIVAARRAPRAVARRASPAELATPYE